jgi:serine/threonine-protein kinase
LFKTLEKNPDDRFSSALEMRITLDQVYRDWQAQSENSCELYQPVKPVRQTTAARLRTQPVRLMYKDIRDVLGLDELFRPLSFNQHQLDVINPLLLYDPATGLYWQRCGSGFALDWQQAHAYVDYLNRERFQNRSIWRLPTTEELVSILRSPTVARDFCIDPNFEPTLHWLWSVDHSTRKQAWMTDIVESYIGRQDRDGTAMVCAVASEAE